jgi:fatty acid desaturase
LARAPIVDGQDQDQEYADLKRLIAERGLLEKQPLYYAFNFALRFAFLAAGIALLFIMNNIWLQFLNAAFLAFAFAQIGYLGHDLGHRQVFQGARRNDRAGLAVNLALGISRSWWVETHNEHHVNPNDLDRDPHTDLPMLAFSEEQAESKRGFWRRVVGYQAFYFTPLLLLEGVGTRLASVQFLLAGYGKDRLLEAGLILLHAALYFGIVFYALGAWQALAFITVHQALFGLYLGLVFAPNHKGMPLLDDESKIGFLRRQVLTSRDVRPGVVTDFMYGGLNYQVEHHLFPSMARNKLRQAQPIVEAFCRERGITYYATSVLQSNKEVLQYFHEVAAPLRNKGKTAIS